MVQEENLVMGEREDMTKGEMVGVITSQMLLSCMATRRKYN